MPTTGCFFPSSHDDNLPKKMRCLPEQNIDVTLVAMPGNAETANVKSLAC
jgi:hypothetical protein